MLINVHPNSECSQEVADLIRASYREGCFRTRSGNINSWILDCRLGLSHSDILKQIITLLSRQLVNEGVCQVVGFGVGATFLIGGLVLHGTHDFRGGILRNRRKKYGTGKELEGDLCPGHRVVIVDDVLNSGQTALRVVTRLRRLGFEDIIFLSIFCFEWGGGTARLEREGVSARSLARITRRDDCSNYTATAEIRTSKIYLRLRQWLRFPKRCWSPLD